MQTMSARWIHPNACHLYDANVPVLIPLRAVGATHMDGIVDALLGRITRDPQHWI
jgi:hypothetical protein